MNPKFGTLILLALNVLARATQLKISAVQVPKYQLSTKDAFLNCTYRLHDESQLYSVKWFHNGDNFYKYEPTPTSSKVKNFPFEGIQVDLSRSHGASVVLTNISKASAGTYKCEVMIDQPTFETAEGEADMSVVDPPQWGPEIEGIHDRAKVKIGSSINVRCVVGMSRPSANLTWFLNDQRMDTQTRISQIRMVNGFGDSQVESQMELFLKREYFKRHILKIDCMAGIYNVFHKVQRILLYDIDRPESHSYLSFLWASGSAPLPSYALLLTLLTLRGLF